MTRMARIIIDFVDKGLRAISALCLLVLSTLVVFQVISRYGWGSVPLFTEETARYAMIWMALLAAAIGVRDAAHIRIDFVPSILGAVSPVALRALNVALDVISLAVFLTLLWFGIDSMIFAAGQTSDGMQIPLSYPYSVLPISFFFASVFAVLRIVALDART
jgi:TRAP-type transport system small permease protein